MKDDVKRLNELLRAGKCCAVALVQLGLESRGQTNEQLLHAMSGLCGGVQSGILCGALTGAACLMNVLDPDHANHLMVPELVTWFLSMTREEYGGATCADILNGDIRNKPLRCPALVVATYVEAKDIMVQFGHEFE